METRVDDARFWLEGFGICVVRTDGDGDLAEAELVVLFQDFGAKNREGSGGVR